MTKKNMKSGSNESVATPHRSSDLRRVASSSHGVKPKDARRDWTVWVWNVPLVISSTAFLIAFIAILLGLYFWQSKRIGNQLIQMADVAAVQEKPQEEIRWLTRYLSLRPDDVERQVRLAIKLDDGVTQISDVDRARRHLNRAIASLSETSHEDTLRKLRKRLIKRLIQLGGGWNLEAQRQIIKLNPKPSDHWAIKMFAQAAIAQRDQLAQSTDDAGPYSSDGNPPNRDEDYWLWIASRPIGEILELAVQANPQSVELTSALIQAYLDKPTFFEPRDASTVTVDQQELQKRMNKASNLIKGLIKERDNGAAMWAAYRFGKREDVSVAIPPLSLLAIEALDRLRERADRLSEQSNLSSNQSGDAFQPVSGQRLSLKNNTDPNGPKLIEPEVLNSVIADDSKMQKSYADVRLVLTLAHQLTTQNEYEKAKSLYQTFVDLPSIFASSGQLELAYLGLGQAHWRLGQPNEAYKVWSTGSELLGGRSLLLLEPLAVYASHNLSIENSKTVLNQFSDAIESASTRLASLEIGETSARRREQLQGQLNSAAWRRGVVKAQLEFRQNKLNSAAERLDRALASQIRVEITSRIEAARLLANIYGQQRLWDLAGRVLDEAAALVPSNISIRRQAAIAWQNAAARSRAVEQWKLADDGSFKAAVSYANALAAELATSSPQKRDLATLADAVSEADRRMQAQLQQGNKPEDAWRLELLKIMTMPEASSSGTVHDDARSKLSGHQAPNLVELKNLGEKYPAIPEVQAIVALTLQRAGEQKGAKVAARRLNALDDTPPLFALEFQARFAIEAGQTDKAVRLLSSAVHERSANATELAIFAARFLKSYGHGDEGLAILKMLQPNQHDPTSLMLLGDFVLVETLADSDETLNSSNGSSTSQSSVIWQKVNQPDAQLEQIIQWLVKLEGQSGTHWRLLRAKQLLLKGDDGINEASRLYSEISARRPRWSPGLILGGRISSAQGDSRRAAELYRRALAEGEQKTSTVLLLVQELNRIGDVAAAEAELAKLESITDSVGQISTLAVGLALQKGEYDSALKRARAGVTSRPDDSQALLLLAQAAIVAARTEQKLTSEPSLSEKSKVSANPNPKEVDRLQSEAEVALNRALEVSRGRDLGIWVAQFRFQLETKGYAAARSVLEALGDSDLPEDVRYLAAANGYLTINDFAEVRSWLEKAQNASPSNPMVALARAKLARATSNNKELIESYEQAYRLAPHEDGIRRRLAIALAVTSPKEIPWDRIDKLIGPDRIGTSTTDQLYHALIMINRGSAKQLSNAKVILEKLRHSDDAQIRDDGTRLLLSAEKRRWENALSKRKGLETKRALDACLDLYKPLIKRNEPEAIDLFGYGDLLIRSDRTTEAQHAIDLMRTHHPTNQLTLQLTLQLARKENIESGTAVQLAKNWLLSHETKSNSSQLVTSACTQLLKADFPEAAVDLAADSYNANRNLLQDYVFILSQTSSYKQIVDVCVKHLQENPSPEPIQLVAEALTQARRMDLVDVDLERHINQSISDYPKNLKLLESVGTLRLTQERFADAIDIYLKSEKLNPVSLITLNNLAVSLSETKGREREALGRAERVVQLYGRNPELLDTLGVALLRAGELEKAETVLREAYDASADPRHMFHLIQVLHQQNRSDAAKKMWSSFDPQSIDQSTLTPNDREQMKLLEENLELRVAA